MPLKNVGNTGARIPATRDRGTNPSISALSTSGATCRRQCGAPCQGLLGVENVRYYQRRRLWPVPHVAGPVRRFPAAVIDRIRPIERWQNGVEDQAMSLVSQGPSQLHQDRAALF
jgi:hypothetical protein